MNTARRVRVGQLPDIARLCLRQVHGTKKPNNPIGAQGLEGHGESIWVFSHRRSDQIIYSFRDKLDGVHDLKQLPFNGKKTKPAKLRKDYWSPMARIEFPKGAGEIGLTVFQKLRELKHLHEVSWDDSLLYKQPLEYTDREKTAAARKKAQGQVFQPMRTKAQRGKALNAQKANSIADIAAVLGGAGAGNKIRIITTTRTNGGQIKEKAHLLDVVVSWSNIHDAGFAETWPENVTHTDLVEAAVETEVAEEVESAV